MNPIEEDRDAVVDALLSNYDFIELHSTNSNSTKPNNIDELLKKYDCEICQEESNRNINKITLSCGHDMCEKCIQKMFIYKKNKVINCPFCRKTLENVRV